MLPFDASALASDGEEQEATYSVAELNGAIADALVDALPRQVWVRGEVGASRISVPSGVSIAASACLAALRARPVFTNCLVCLL
jgi:hypothetical protein